MSNTLVPIVLRNIPEPLNFGRLGTLRYFDLLFDLFVDFAKSSLV